MDYTVEITLTCDIELTNRCNATCHFCPRDATPHQGIMTPEIFDQSLARAIEFGATAREQLGIELAVSLCGLGEPLLNRNAVTFVRKVREAGLPCIMSSNAALLDAEKGRALLDAGLQKICINVADEGEAYTQVYNLPFQKTRDNIVRFAEVARDRCDVSLVIVNHRRDLSHVEQMKDYWRAQGINQFIQYEVVNRAGSLFVDHMRFETYPELAQARAMLDASEEHPICGAPFVYLFIGWDGQYYLCCSDWKKEVPLGSVFDTSFLAVTRKKMLHVLHREPICKRCNHDPLNRLTEQLRSVEKGEAAPGGTDALLAHMRESSEAVRSVLSKVGEAAAAELPFDPPHTEASIFAATAK
ncbi:MAG: radical SAM protein [Myxococcales bacterium]|nr:MAG: radical SAM protein [Myxococcales bacterium]